MILTNRMIRDLLYFKGPMSIGALMAHYKLPNEANSVLKLSEALDTLIANDEVRGAYSVSKGLTEFKCIVEVKG